MGGSQVLIADMLNELCPAHDVSLIIINNDKCNENLLQKLNEKITVYRINRKAGSRSPFSLLRLNLLLRNLKPDIVHCHNNKIINLFVFYTFKTVFTLHAMGIDISTLKKYTAAIAISSSVAVDVLKRSGKRIKTVYNGIPINSFRTRNSYVLGENETIKIVQISRLIHETKGQDILIKALNKLVKEKNMSGISLDFIGDGDSFEYLKSLQETLDLRSKINFLGDRSRDWIQQNLADYHILVQPSRYEGFGLTVIEGIAAGLPVAVSDNDGPAEIMKEIQCDFVFKKNDVDACADVLIKIIKLYKSNQIIDKTQRAHEVIKDKYSIQSTTSNYLELYDSLLQS
jgi:glycosyltransferase involved in cell wall biosynthesis